MCDYQATRQSRLTEHKQSVHLGNKYFCTICGQKVSHLNRHIKSKHSEREYLFCDSCNKQFLSKGALSNHLRLAHQGITHICDICPFETIIKINLTKHIKSIHLNEKDCYQCNICDYQATYKSNLSRHVKRIHQKNENIIICTECNKLLQKCSLPQHMKLFHSKEQIQYKCNICTYKTIHQQNLQSHCNRIHKNLK